MSRGKLSDRRARHDPFHRRARREGFASRAVFKLEEIDQKLQIFTRGARVLDLGCAPGSWLQYASQRVGHSGHLVGIDRNEVEIAGARTLVGDIFETSVAELLGELEAFDVILSDMAPDTIGVRHVDQARSENLFERALEIAAEALSPGGKLRRQALPGTGVSGAHQALPPRLLKGEDRQTGGEPHRLYRAVHLRDRLSRLKRGGSRAAASLRSGL